MRGGIIRIVIINTLCLLTVFYSGIRYFSPSAATAIIPAAADSEKIQQKEENESKTNSEKTTENDKNKEVSQSQSSSASSASASSSSQTGSAKPTSAAAVKGKIVSRYISPYTAGLSYDSVYVKNSSGLDISIKKYLQGKINFEIEKNDSPQVLIMHTHATESFMTDDSDVYTEDFTSRSRDNSKNMVAVGEAVAKKLNDAGIKTLHDKTQHDYPSYTDSYSRAAETIVSYLKKYPSIKVVLDLHRDAISGDGTDKVKVVTEIDGKKAAQVMLVMGSQSGSVTNFPKWEENFKLAVRLQQIFEKNYPTLARPLMLASKNYNESLTTGSMLIEFGTDANTLSEVMTSAEMVGDSLVKLLNGLT